MLFFYFTLLCTLTIPTITMEIQVNNSSVNSTTNIEKITQPLHLQSEQIESIQPPNLNNSSINNEANKFKPSTSEFKPSVQLETYYEFNKIPVEPALAEPKTKFDYWQTNSDGGIVKFPTSPSLAPTPGKSDHFQFNKQIPSTVRGNNVETNFQFNKLIPTSLDGYKPYRPMTTNGLGVYNHHQPSHKTNHEYNLYEKPSSNSEIQEYPWKKIIKFLTAVIPVGLLISALTPTVITVTPVNETFGRSRTTKTLSSSILNKTNEKVMPCEDKILCELLLSATISSNGDQHVENLLNIFTERHSNAKTEDLKRIFNAVKNQNCDTITCSSTVKT